MAAEHERYGVLEPEAETQEPANGSEQARPLATKN